MVETYYVTAITRPGIARWTLVLALMGAMFLSSVASDTAVAASAAESRMHTKINRARERRGLEPLRLGGKLSRRARAHSRVMREAGTIFHSDLRETVQGFSWRLAGENVGMGPNMKVLHRAFMNSKGHRDNVLNPRYKRVGIGVKWENGMAFITVLFLG